MRRGGGCRRNRSAARSTPRPPTSLGVCEQALGHAGGRRGRPGAGAAGFPFRRRRGDGARPDLDRRPGPLRRGRGASSARPWPRRGANPSAARLRYALSQLLYWEGRLDEMRRLSQEGWENSPDRPGDLHDLWRIDNAPPTFEPIQAAVERAGAPPRTTTASGWRAPTSRCTPVGRRGRPMARRLPCASAR